MRNVVGERGFYDAERPPTLSVIPGSRAEVLSAARLLRANTVVLTDADATESAFKAQDLGDFAVLHFALHAFADPEFPARAALVLLSDAAAGGDGLLQPHEISGLALNASLVVLSACDTAVGPTIGQEGVQNLARAFLLAGARAVITTLWAVNDTVSLELMRAFYAQLAEGQTVAAALAEAKREVSQRLPDWVIRAQFGHVSPAMMAVYSHVRRKALDEAAKALEPDATSLPENPNDALVQDQRVTSHVTSQPTSARRHVIEFPKKSGSSGWARTSNPPVNSLMQVFGLAGSSCV